MGDPVPAARRRYAVELTGGGVMTRIGRLAAVAVLAAGLAAAVPASPDRKSVV